MFDKAVYSAFRATAHFRKYVIYCVIGCTGFAVTGFAIATIGLLGIAGGSMLYALLFIPAAVCLAVPVGFIVNSRRKPYVCSRGTVIAINGGRAEIKAGDITLRNAVSFEKFLKNASLDSYSPGEEVIVISFAKKDRRPMFYKA